MMASVPRIRARGRLRAGSFTSPLMNDRSAQPSYAHITDTIAVASAERPRLPVQSGVKLRAGSFTSPLMNDRSAQPSYAHITDTIAVASAERPRLPVQSGEVAHRAGGRGEREEH